MKSPVSRSISRDMSCGRGFLFSLRYKLLLPVFTFKWRPSYEVVPQLLSPGYADQDHAQFANMEWSHNKRHEEQTLPLLSPSLVFGSNKKNHPSVCFSCLDGSLRLLAPAYFLIHFCILLQSLPFYAVMSIQAQQTLSFKSHVPV